MKGGCATGRSKAENEGKTTAEVSSRAPRSQPEARLESREDFFIWIRRNPLKRPESAKGIQGNASLFPWIYLVFLGFIWR
jgi:hypothetical protein